MPDENKFALLAARCLEPKALELVANGSPVENEWQAEMLIYGASQAISTKRLADVAKATFHVSSLVASLMEDADKERRAADQAATPLARSNLLNRAEVYAECARRLHATILNTPKKD